MIATWSSSRTPYLSKSWVTDSYHTSSQMAEQIARGQRAKRAQVSKACDRCRRLQKACSSYRPCRRCERAGIDCSDGTSANAHDPPVVFTSPFANTAPFVDFPATSPQDFHSFPRLSFKDQRNLALLPADVVEYCEIKFLERLYSTVPLLTSDYFAFLKATAASSEPESDSAWCLLAAVCADLILVWSVVPSTSHATQDVIDMVAMHTSPLNASRSSCR